MSRSIRSRRGVTLVEVLVSIAIIAVLLTILQPALLGARSTATQTECLATLKQIGHAIQMHTDRNGGFWLGSSEEEQPYVIDGAANTARLIRPLAWAVWWQVRLEGILWERRETAASRYAVDPRTMCCPEVLRDFDEQTAWEQADFVSSRSFVLSPTLLTDPRAWALENHEAREDLPRHARRLPVTIVRSPSAKVVLIETADHHGTGAPLHLAERFNALLADGSVRRLSRVETREPLPFRWPDDGHHGNDALVPGASRALPGLGTPLGAHGADF